MCCGCPNKQKGFTLIELLLVIGIIGILSGVTLSIVNQGRQRDRAQDAVNKDNLMKVATALESYYYAEGNYPAETSTPPAGNGNPLLDLATNVSLDNYLKAWPDDSFVYITDTAVGVFPTKFNVYVIKKVDGRYYKYISGSSLSVQAAAISECSATNISVIDTCNP